MHSNDCFQIHVQTLAGINEASSSYQAPSQLWSVDAHVQAAATKRLSVRPDSTYESTVELTTAEEFNGAFKEDINSAQPSNDDAWRKRTKRASGYEPNRSSASQCSVPAAERVVFTKQYSMEMAKQEMAEKQVSSGNAASSASGHEVPTLTLGKGSVDLMPMHDDERGETEL